MALKRGALALLASFSTLASLATAQLSTYDAGNGITYAVNVPEATAQSGTGDFFFQISGPATNSWIALGIGQGMTGASIFIMYATGDAANPVVVSPRLSGGNRMPQPNTSPAQVTLLDGSGIENGMMVANVKCSGCSTWGDSGKIDYTSSSQSFIWAVRAGPALNTTTSDARLVQHQNNGRVISIDLTQATGGASANPFGVQTVPVTQPGNNMGSDTGSAEAEVDYNPELVRAHGIIMGLTVVGLIPLGALAMRLSPMPWWLHAAVQLLSLSLFTAGWGIGYYFAGTGGQPRFMGEIESDKMHHTILGTVVFALFWLMPFLGAAHRLIVGRGKEGREPASIAHIWLGRITMILAIVNGGLGLKLADDTRAGTIAYGVLAGVVGVVYIAGASFGEWRRARRAPAKAESSSGGSEPKP